MKDDSQIDEPRQTGVPESTSPLPMGENASVDSEKQQQQQQQQ